MSILLVLATITGVAMVKDMVAYCVNILRQPSGDFYEESED
jgi:hypothetical protein